MAPARVRLRARPFGMPVEPRVMGYPGALLNRQSDEAGLEFLAGGGEMGRLMRRFDWSATPLGPLERWPQSLKTATALLLRTHVPIVMLWGEDGVMIYNDAYSVFAGGRHPHLLGSKVREGWPEVADFNDNVMKVGLAGGTLAYKNQELTLYRTGRAEQVWMDLDYSPVIDESGRPAGVLAVVIETTERVIAERRRIAAEAALRAERDRLVSVMGGMAEGFVLLDHDFRIREVNAEALRLETRPREALLGKTHWEAYPGSEESELGRLYKRAMAERTPVSLVHKYPGKDGRAAWFDMRAYPVSEGLAILYRDVTERKQGEEALREAGEASEAQSAERAAILGQLAEGVIVTDPQGRITFVNEAAARLHGVDALGVTPDGYSDAYHLFTEQGEPYPPQDLPLSRAVLHGETVVDARWRIRRADGTEVIAIGSARPITDAGGAKLGAVLTVRDDTVRRSTEEALREESRRLETLNRTGAAIAGELDLERLVQSVTDAGVELTGAQFGAFFYNVLNDAGESYMLYTLSGAQRADFEKFGMPRATAVFQPTFKGEGPLRSDDILADARYGRSDPHRGMPKGHLPVRSYLAVPVTSRSGEVLGGLFFGHAEPRRFEERHEGLMLGLAAQAAVAIDNARLFQAAQREIAERRRAEDELRASEARYRTLTEGLPQLVWTCLPDGSCDYLSRQWVEYTGTPAEDQLGLGWLDRVIHPEDKQRTLDHWMGAVAGRHPYDIEYRIRRHDGAYRWFKTRGTPLRGEDGAIVSWFGTCTDIQDVVEAREVLARSREELEELIRARTEELMQAEAQLRQAQKMEAVGQLTGGLAHDFNNLLTGVIGSLDMLQRRLSQGRTTEMERYANTAITAANRAAALTHRLLAFSRRQPLDPKPVNANRLVTGMEELLRRTIGEAIRLEIVTAGGLWLTLCDPHQLESALLNLAINARDAMPGGGMLTVETCNAHLDNAYAAQEREVKPGQYICICVTDTGTGMTPDVIAKAFEPFFTTKPIGQGTGLGLSMIYGFARQSEGYAKIYSEVGRGTTVKLYLPRYYGETEHAEDQQGGLNEAHRSEHGEVVLVVEDETAVRDLVTDVLAELGYHALEAPDGTSGLRLLQSDRRIDLLVTDVGLPGLNGRQLADAARRHRPDLKVLFMTGYAENATIASGFLEPGMQMITKPFAIEALATRIRDMIEG